MKRFFLFAVLFLIAFPALAVTVVENLKEIQGSGYNAVVTVRPINNFTTTTGGIISGAAKSYTPVNGLLTITNLLAGHYQVAQAGKVMYVTSTNDSSTITNSLREMATNGLTFWSWSGYVGNIATNAYVTAAGSGVSITTNSSAKVYTITARPTTNAADLTTGTLPIARLPVNVHTNGHSVPATFGASVSIPDGSLTVGGHQTNSQNLVVEGDLIASEVYLPGWGNLSYLATDGTGKIVEAIPITNNNAQAVTLKNSLTVEGASAFTTVYANDAVFTNLAASIIDNTNIIDGTINSNKLDAATLALLGGTFDLTADHVWSGSNYHTGPVVISSDQTNDLGWTTFSQGFFATATGTNELGFTTLTNVPSSSFLFQGSDGVIIGSGDVITNNYAGAVSLSSSLSLPETGGNLFVAGAQTNTGTMRVEGDATFTGDATFSGSTTVESLIAPHTTWTGPTNEIALGSAIGRAIYVTETDCAITNVTGLTAGQTRSTCLTVSNSTASAITLRFTGTARAIGSATTNALSIAAGKTGDFLVEAVGGMYRYTTASEQ